MLLPRPGSLVIEQMINVPPPAGLLYQGGPLPKNHQGRGVHVKLWCLVVIVDDHLCVGDRRYD